MRNASHLTGDVLGQIAQNTCMTTYVAFLRAVNVGGTGKLPMADLRQICLDAGCANVVTYIASGNVVFTSDQSRQKVSAQLSERLEEYAGKPIDVFLRTAAELRRIYDENPFRDRNPKFAVAIFLTKKPAGEATSDVRGMVDEEIVLGRQEIYVYYGSGIGKSKLKLPAAWTGTARNMNTIEKMTDLATTRQVG